MSLADFFDLTPGELISAISEFRKQERVGWRQTQLLMFASMRPHYKKLSPNDCMALPWDTQESKPVMAEIDKEKAAEIVRKMDERAKQEYLNTLN